MSIQEDKKRNVQVNLLFKSEQTNNHIKELTHDMYHNGTQLNTVIMIEHEELLDSGIPTYYEIIMSPESPHYNDVKKMNIKGIKWEYLANKLNLLGFEKIILVITYNPYQVVGRQMRLSSHKSLTCDFD